MHNLWDSINMSISWGLIIVLSLCLISTPKSDIHWAKAFSVNDFEHLGQPAPLTWLYASCEKGNRPSYMAAMKNDEAIKFYEMFNRELEKYIEVETGEFGADMDVEINNIGPTTIWLERWFSCFLISWIIKL